MSQLLRLFPWLASVCAAPALFVALSARAADVPPFMPNVVDTAGMLSADEVAEINGALQVIRDKADIWGAVLIVDSLADDTIETLAERAFNKWGLGQKGKDNGLLLVLAMKERESRFEVGYGLEGDITDIASGRALRDVLRPYMRKGEVKTAVVKSFSYLAGIKSKNPVFENDLTNVRAEAEEEMKESDFDLAAGWLGLIPYLLCLWFLGPVVKIRNLQRARRLASSHAAYRIEDDDELNHGKLGWRFLLFGKAGSPAVFLKPFLTINPGIFIWLGSALHPLGVAVTWALTALVALPYFLLSGKKYISRESYETWIEKERASNQEMVEKGYKKEVRPGVFEFTPSWYSSSEYRESRDSSSSSDSSSGGGRSGGGGSSSSW
jgi:uncharacterized protein